MPTPIASSVFGPPKPVDFDPQFILESIYTNAMVDSYADQGAATAARERMRPIVTRMAELLPQIRASDPAAVREALSIMRGAGLKEAEVNSFLRGQQVSDATLERVGLDPVAVNPDKALKALMPTITGSDPAAATAALRRGLTICKNQFGYTGPEPLYYWLSKNVKNDDVLRGAGIDPEEMRRATAPGDPHPDVAALLEVSKNILAVLVRQNPDLAAADANSAAATQAFTAFTDTPRALPAANGGGQRLSVRDLLALPIRA